MSIQLYRRVMVDISLEEAIRFFVSHRNLMFEEGRSASTSPGDADGDSTAGPEEGGKEKSCPVALLYTPRKCVVARLEGAQLKDARGEGISPNQVHKAKGRNRVSLAHVFEARVFDEDLELRWLAETGGKSRAVLLSERPIAAEPEMVAFSRVFLSHRKNQYLLWGQADPPNPRRKLADGWTSLSEAQVGAIDVPVQVPPGQRAVLNTREYYEVLEPHHNVVVGEERFLGFGLYHLVDTPSNPSSMSEEVDHG